MNENTDTKPTRKFNIRPVWLIVNIVFTLLYAAALIPAVGLVMFGWMAFDPANASSAFLIPFTLIMPLSFILSIILIWIFYFIKKGLLILVGLLLPVIHIAILVIGFLTVGAGSV